MTYLLCMININHTSKYTYDLPTMYDKQKSYIKIHIMTNQLCMINRNNTSKYTYDLPTMYDKQKPYIKIHI